MNRKAQVWIVHENRVLLFKVIPRRGGGWHPVTGSVEKDEELLEGAKRETTEETGLNVKAGRWLSLDYCFEYDGRWGKAQEHAFAFVLTEAPVQIQLDPKEHQACKWVELEKAITELGFESQKKALEKLKCILSKI